MTVGSRVVDQRVLSRTLKLSIFEGLLHEASDQQLPGGLLFLLCLSVTRSTPRLLEW